MRKKEKAFNSWCGDNGGVPLDDKETARYIRVVPDSRQQEYLKLKYYNFIHFGINTFLNNEWGRGDEDISLFSPSALDTDQWCRVLKSTGSKGIIITAKHHDGFCLFDTCFTEHNVMNTPFGKDIVKLLSESCKKYGLRLGIYLSPWDRHEKAYGSDAYNDFFVSQLKELCLNYGEIFCFWFDGACGEGPDGKKQKYDWDRYYSVIREYQPQAVIAVSGPDVRWIGNEGGRVRESEWSVIPEYSDTNDTVAQASQTQENQTQLMAKGITERDRDLGSRQVLSQYSSLIFKPAEADVSVNTGWFWHPDSYYRFKKKRNGKDLARIYFNTVGGNASLLLNVPANKQGLIDKREIKILEDFTKRITKPFEKEITDGLFYAHSTGRQLCRGDMELRHGEAGIRLVFKERKKISLVTLEENLSHSQRVEAFELYALKGENSYIRLFKGTVIGSGKFIRFKRPVRTREILIIIRQSRSNPVLSDIRAYS